jgi:hypothetical protein
MKLKEISIKNSLTVHYGNYSNKHKGEYDKMEIDTTWEICDGDDEVEETKRAIKYNRLFLSRRYYQILKKLGRNVDSKLQDIESKIANIEVEYD